MGKELNARAGGGGGGGGGGNLMICEENERQFS